MKLNTMSEKPLPTSFEEAIQELETIVKNLEDGRLSLEESLVFYERGHALKVYCDEKLKSARMKIDEITRDRNGEVTLKPSSLSHDE